MNHLQQQLNHKNNKNYCKKTKNKIVFISNKFNQNLLKNKNKLVVNKIKYLKGNSNTNLNTLVTNIPAFILKRIQQSKLMSLDQFKLIFRKKKKKHLKCTIIINRQNKEKNSQYPSFRKNPFINHSIHHKKIYCSLTTLSKINYLRKIQKQIYQQMTNLNKNKPNSFTKISKNKKLLMFALQFLRAPTRNMIV